MQRLLKEDPGSMMTKEKEYRIAFQMSFLLFSTKIGLNKGY